MRAIADSRSIVVVAMLACCWSGGRVAAAEPASPTLDQVVGGQARIVDLAWPLNERAAYWPGEPYEPFKLRTIATIENDGVLSKAFCTPEHLGTHVDAPNHFAAGQKPVDQIAPHELFATGVMIDVSAAVAMDADYRLEPDDIRRWEAQRGPIPSRAIVLLNTGWGRHWGNTARYQNRDPRGQMHFPGYSTAAAQWLVRERNVRALGIDTMSIDYGLSRDFAVHKVVNGAGRYGIENLAQLDKLPARGFWLMVAPVKIESGSGGPARVFAVLPGGER